VKRLILFGLLGGLLAANTGCGLLQAVFCYRPCLSRGDCGPDLCGDPCDDGCGPTCRPGYRGVREPIYGARRAAVYADDDMGCDGAYGGPCRRAARRTCDPCADPCGGGYCRPWYRGPLSCVFALFSPATWCGSNCGQRYWGDFYSDPPDCWDPCDSCGNYTGSTGGECSSCGGSGRQHGGFDGYTRGRRVEGDYDSQDNVISENDRSIEEIPKPAPQPHKATRP
jgi:hypothetical protein